MQLIDNPWQNPYKEEINLAKSYLQAGYLYDEYWPYIFGVELILAPSKTIRKRTVYSLIELIAEVSGLADIFNISAAFFFAYYTSRAQKAELVEEMVSFRSRKRPKFSAKSVVTEFLEESGIRFRLSSNIWLKLTAGLCPRPWHHPREVSRLKLQAKAMAKIAKSLDISRAIEM